MRVVRNVSRGVFYLSPVYGKRLKEYRVSYFFYPSPVSPKEGTEKVPLPHKNGNNTRLKSCICQYFFVPLHKNKAYVTATERT